MGDLSYLIRWDSVQAEPVIQEIHRAIVQSIVTICSEVHTVNTRPNTVMSTLRTPIPAILGGVVG